MGNPLLCDDGIGLKIAAELRDRVNQAEIDVMETGIAGLALLDLLVGYDTAIIIDAIQTVDGKPGRIYKLDTQAFDSARRAVSPHDIDFTTALEFGSKLGLPMPERVTIFAIETSDVCTFSEECTPEVQKAIPRCVRMVLKELKKGQ
jgi:hydrogenase maturation protease